MRLIFGSKHTVFKGKYLKKKTYQSLIWLYLINIWTDVLRLCIPEVKHQQVLMVVNLLVFAKVVPPFLLFIMFNNVLHNICINQYNTNTNICINQHDIMEHYVEISQV